MKVTKERMAGVLPVFFTILMIALCRLLPHPWNFVPVSASAIFGGIYLNKKWAFILPIASMIIADIVLGFSLADMPFVYGSILLSVLVGMWISSKRENKPAFALYTVFGTLSSSVMFYLITNFGSWATLSMYSKDVNGLIQSYVMALPFFRNSVAGDLFFISVFITAYELTNILVTKMFNKPAGVVAK